MNKTRLVFLLVFSANLIWSTNMLASYVDPTGEVEGRVKLYERSCDFEGIFYAYDQIEDADVTLYDENDKKIDSDDSNSDGEFSFDDVDTDKEYYIKCEKKGYVDAKDPDDEEYKSGKFDVDADKTVVKNCRLMKDEELNCAVVPQEIFIPEDPVCGDAQREYSIDESDFDGPFCEVGVVVEVPKFPAQGKRVTWTCSSDDLTETCSALRANPVVEKEPTKNIVEPPKTPEKIETPTQEEPQPKVNSDLLKPLAIGGIVSGTTIAFATSAVPFFVTMPMAAKDFFIMPFIGLLARRRNEQNWGTVFEQRTKQPIPAVKLTLVDQMNKEIETTYSDQHGRFGFLTENGTFRIVPEKKKYDVDYTHDSDSLYENVYTGEDITIDQNAVLITNIAMTAVGTNWEEYADKKIKRYTGAFAAFKKWSFIIIFYAGFVATAVITYLFPSIINIILLSLYTLLFIYDNFIKHKKFGTVVTDEDNPIPFAIVSLHDKSSGVKNNFAVTDVIGRYYMLSENGKYDIRIKGQPISGKQFEKQGSVHVRNGIVREHIRV
jgi:hypothetical protein